MKIPIERIRAVVQNAVNHLLEYPETTAFPPLESYQLPAHIIEACLGMLDEATPSGPQAIPYKILQRIAKESKKKGLSFWQIGLRRYIFTREGENVEILRVVPQRIFGDDEEFDY